MRGAHCALFGTSEGMTVSALLVKARMDIPVRAASIQSDGRWRLKSVFCGNAETSMESKSVFIDKDGICGRHASTRQVGNDLVKQIIRSTCFPVSSVNHESRSLGSTSSRAN